MKEFVEKLIGRLEEYKYSHLIERNSEQCEHCKYIEDCENRDCSLCIWDKSIEIVNKLAEEYKPKTQADKIRAMNDEELAEFLYGLDHYWDDEQCILRINDNHLNDYKDDILDWLQSEAETKGE